MMFLVGRNNLLESDVIKPTQLKKTEVPRKINLFDVAAITIKSLSKRRFKRDAFGVKALYYLLWNGK